MINQFCLPINEFISWMVKMMSRPACYLQKSWGNPLTLSIDSCLKIKLFSLKNKQTTVKYIFKMEVEYQFGNLNMYSAGYVGVPVKSVRLLR